MPTITPITVSPRDIGEVAQIFGRMWSFVPERAALFPAFANLPGFWGLLARDDDGATCGLLFGTDWHPALPWYDTTVAALSEDAATLDDSWMLIEVTAPGGDLELLGALLERLREHLGDRTILIAAQAEVPEGIALLEKLGFRELARGLDLGAGLEDTVLMATGPQDLK